MTRPIQQSVTVNAAPRELFNTFLDSKKHTALTGAPAKIGKKAGAAFTAFGGQLSKSSHWCPVNDW
jgi:activator of HSP90 ATPase